LLPCRPASDLRPRGRTGCRRADARGQRHAERMASGPGNLPADVPGRIRGRSCPPAGAGIRADGHGHGAHLLPAASQAPGPVLLAGFVSTHRCGAAPEWVRKAPSPDSRLNPSLHRH